MNDNAIEMWKNWLEVDEIAKGDFSKRNFDFGDAFSKNLEFGTAGIRGKMGAGSNRMNELTIKSAAFAYGNFLKSKFTKGNIKIVIGHDNRHNSPEFSKITASILNGMGIESYLFNNNDLQPTPVVSFTIREMKLQGGVVITASHNPKEYNGFKAYNDVGGQLLPHDTVQIQKNMASQNVFTKYKIGSDNKFISDDIINKYKEKNLKDFKSKKRTANIAVSFSPLHGTTAKIIPSVLEEMGAKVHTVESQMRPDPNFSKTKSSNPEEAKSFKAVIKNARKNKSDIAIITDPDGDRFGVAVKYQKRFKYLNGNQIAALYLDYKLSSLKVVPKNSYIVTTHVSGILAQKIAKKHGVEVIKTHVGFKNIANVIENTKGNFIMGYEESFGFLLNENLARDKDSIQATIAIAGMVSEYKAQGINLYTKLKLLYNEYGIHRTFLLSKTITADQVKTLMKDSKKIKNIGDKKVRQVEDFRKIDATDLVKINFEDGSWFAIRPSGTEPKVKIYIQTIGTKKQRLMDIVSFEKEIQNFIDDKTELFGDKKWSWKAFVKYTIFVLLITGIMAFVFTNVYDQGVSGNVWHDMKTVMNRIPRVAWMSMMLFIVLNTLVSAWMRKRLIEFQGQKVKLRHLFISSLMGVIISYITPFAVGGDAIGYWYLRRKGIKRGPLLSSFITSTIMWQVGFIAQSLVLVPLGIPLYKSILFSGSSQSHATFILYIIGFSWDIFSTIMILSLALGKRFQEFIVRNAIKIGEWSRFMTVADPGKISSSYQYEFREMRYGLKKIWTKKRLILEIIFYELLPKFFDGMAIWLIAAGVISPDASPNTYLVQIIGSDMNGTANTMSLTPGGSGTGEWLGIQINKAIYNKNFKGVPNTKALASSVDLLRKVIYAWPHLIASALMIPTVIIGEQRKKKYRRNKLLGRQKISTNYYKWVTMGWIGLAIGYILFIQLI